MISCRDWWPWTKPGHITMTRRQSNNQWSVGIAAQPAPKIPSAKIRWRRSRLYFVGSKRHPPHWLSSKGPTIKAEYNSSLLVQMKDFWRKNAEGRSSRGSCSSTTMPRLTEHLQPRRNWPTWASSFLIAHPILRIWTRRTTTFSLDWKKKVAIFRQTQRSLLPRRSGWTDNLLFFFLSNLQKLEQRTTKKCIALRGEYVE